ncbi:glucokinase [Ascosphaera pollenicola]|nr:glucokinase [Ascosphaera pollenicola]
MARAYTSCAGDRSLLGAIFGTGTNGAYVEKLSKVKKLKETLDESSGEMIINCEWGSFDNPLKVLPNTQWDVDINKASVNKDYHMFEKRVSGVYLGELLRRVMLDLIQDKDTPLFAKSKIPDDSVLFQTYGIDTSFLSAVEADDSVELNAIANHLVQTLGIDNPTFEDCEAIQILCKCIGLRSARLAAVAISSVIIQSGRLEEHTAIDIGVDGSLVELYPHYEEMIRMAMHEIPEVGVEGEQKITIGIAKDGSGIGAALGALIATKGRNVYDRNLLSKHKSLRIAAAAPDRSSKMTNVAVVEEKLQEFCSRLEALESAMGTLEANVRFLRSQPESTPRQTQHLNNDWVNISAYMIAMRLHLSAMKAQETVLDQKFAGQFVRMENTYVTLRRRT